MGQMTAFVLTETAAKQTPAEVVKTLRTLRETDAKAAIVSEDSVNNLAYVLMGKSLYAQAVAVFSLNTENFPRSPNTWDSLADGFFHAGDIPKAVENYKRALDMDRSYSNAPAARKFIEEHSQK
jgi:tetratricopeptide (TPR) repeat protein